MSKQGEFFLLFLLGNEFGNPDSITFSLGNAGWVKWMDMVHVSGATHRGCLLLPAIWSHKKLWFLILAICPYPVN